MQFTFPVLSLIAANLVPIFGVLFMGWDVGSILLLYWIESLVIGILNIPKILMAKGFIVLNIFNAAFFAVHFGGFSAGHGLFLKEMFEVDLSVKSILTWDPITIAAVSFFVSHFISMVINFFGRREYEKRTSSEQMFAPYGRVVVMHLTIIFGGILAQKFGAPAFALLVLIAIKTTIDLMAHNREHREMRNEIGKNTL